MVTVKEGNAEYYCVISKITQTGLRVDKLEIGGAKAKPCKTIRAHFAGFNCLRLALFQLGYISNVALTDGRRVKNCVSRAHCRP